jgi:hypothetical protein
MELMGQDGELARLVEAIEPRLARAYGPGRSEEALAEAIACAWEHRSEVLAMENPAGFLYRMPRRGGRGVLDGRSSACCQRC